MKPETRHPNPAEDAATAAALATWAGDRPGILRILECRLLHRGDWQYLGTRDDRTIAPWPVDNYRCDRCARTWDTPT